MRGLKHLHYYLFVEQKIYLFVFYFYLFIYLIKRVVTRIINKSDIINNKDQKPNPIQEIDSSPFLTDVYNT